MSLRPSVSFPSSCSGGMYWKVPRMVPFCVRPRASVGMEDRPPSGGGSGIRNFANPKSSSFDPDFVSMMLPGFRSRWKTPCRWASASPSAISMAYRKS